MEKPVQALKCLVEGCSVRSTARLTGLDKNTVLALLQLAGEKCRKLMSNKLRWLDCRQIQIDEIWSFVGKKQKWVTMKDPAEFGDQYTFVALDPETKLVVSLYVGKRDGHGATLLLKSIQKRIRSRVQITSDAFRPYIEAIESTYGSDVDYAQLIKVYGGEIEPGRERYSPARIVRVHPSVLQGNPDPSLVSTSHVERQNLTMRMAIRRMTRLTNGFSKRVRNLRAAVALRFAYYNFCRIHSTLRVTPAMEAGVTEQIWSIEDLLST